MMADNIVEIENVRLSVEEKEGAELSVNDPDVVQFADIQESVSPYAEMMEALKKYIDSLIINVGDVTFCETLPDTGESNHLYIETSTATAYIWIDDSWVALAGEGVPIYTGETTVIPKVAQQQTLETANTRMEDDVTVTKIPVSDIDNDKGGKTVTIG